MRRVLLKIVVGLSSILFVVTVALWLSCIRYEIVIERGYVWKNKNNSNVRDGSVMTLGHGVTFDYFRVTAEGTHFADDWEHERPNPQGILARRTVEPMIGYQNGPWPRWATKETSVSPILSAKAATGFLPFWCILVVAAPLPLTTVVRRIRRGRRVRRNQCGRCGYDLTGNSSGICPECGSRIEGTESLTAPSTKSSNGVQLS